MDTLQFTKNLKTKKCKYVTALVYYLDDYRYGLNFHIKKNFIFYLDIYKSPKLVYFFMISSGFVHIYNDHSLNWYSI